MVIYKTYGWMIRIMKGYYGDVLIFSISIAVIQSVSMPIISFGKCNSMKKYEDWIYEMVLW